MILPLFSNKPTRKYRSDVYGQPLVTTYTYTAAGELAATDYSDATAAITYTYTRSGQQQTVTDAAGIHSFTYTATLQAATETLPAATYGDADHAASNLGKGWWRTQTTWTYGKDNSAAATVTGRQKQRLPGSPMACRPRA